MKGVYFTCQLLGEDLLNLQIKKLQKISDAFEAPYVSYGSQDIRNCHDRPVFVFENFIGSCMNTLEYFLIRPEDEFRCTENTLRCMNVSVSDADELAELGYLIKEFDDVYYQAYVYRVNWVDV